MVSLYFLELTDVLQPAQVGFRCHDRSLSMPYVESGEELIPLLMLLSLAFAGPAASVSTLAYIPWKGSKVTFVKHITSSLLLLNVTPCTSLLAENIYFLNGMVDFMPSLTSISSCSYVLYSTFSEIWESMVLWIINHSSGQIFTFKNKLSGKKQQLKKKKRPGLSGLQ